jgi:hypothetical protein
MVSPCYNYKEIYFQRGVLDDSVDATYILHLEGNGRLSNIYKQLQTFHPSKKVIIVFNKGFKECEKDLYKNTSSYDIVDAFLNVLKDAEEKNYKNILVLEDDFMFNPIILDSKNTNAIAKFIKERNEKKESFIYSLGCLPFLQVPINYYNRRVLVRMGAHACIYTQECRRNILDTEQNTIYDWDVYTNLYFTKYMFYQPLCYQLFPDTENKKNWVYIFLFTEIFNGFLDYLGLDRNVEPGYSFFYLFSIFLFIFLSILFSYLLVKTGIYLSKSKKFKIG